MRKISGAVAFFLAVFAALALRAGDENSRERLLAALPPDVSFIYIEHGAFFKSGFAAGLGGVKDDLLQKMLDCWASYAEIADAEIMFSRRPFSDGKSYSGRIVISPCADPEEFLKKEAEIDERFTIDDAPTPVVKSTTSAIALGPHLFLLAEKSVVDSYVSVGLPEAVAEELEEFEDCQIFYYGASEFGSLCGGIEFDGDDMLLSLEADFQDVKTAETIAGACKARAVATAGMLKVKDPALADKFLDTFSCEVENGHVSSSQVISSSIMAAAFDLMMPTLRKSLDLAMKMAADERGRQLLSAAIGIENNNPTGGK